MLTLIKDLGRGKLSPKHKTTTHNGLYKCDCGNTETLNMNMVKQYNIGECLKCKNNSLSILLGANYSKLKKVWFYMIERCHNPEHPNYKNYGAKGIIVCEEWRNSFKIFETWAYQNGYQEEPGVSLDKDFKAWALNIKPIYSPAGAMFMLSSKNAELRRRLK